MCQLRVTDLLGGYLPLFAAAAGNGWKPSRHRTFIDLFAGTVTNKERYTERVVESSPTLALAAEPPFTHMILGELGTKAKNLRLWLQDSEPPVPAWSVFDGDSNQTISDMFAWWRGQGTCRSGPHLGATLAYIDPDGLQAAWDTVETIARFGMEKCHDETCYVRPRRIEQLILLPTGSMRRALPRNGKIKSHNETKVDRLFGTGQWRDIYADQVDGLLDDDDSWLLYVDLYRRRLLDLGYKHVVAVETRNTRNVMLYHMVFATDHAKGNEIMERVLEQARELLPRMMKIDIERSKRRGMDSLFPELHNEMRAIAAEPERYARLLVEEPRPYGPGSGRLPIVGPAQRSLFG